MPSSTSPSYGSLLLRLQDHDETAWGEFVDLFAPLIFHWCRQWQLNPSDSADLMQDVFTIVAIKINQFRLREGGTLRGWLFVITQNKVRDFFRSQRERFSAIGGSTAQLKLNQLVDPCDDLTHDELTTELESRRLVRRALKLIEQDFQPVTWAAFWRSVVEGEDTQSIANELSLSPNSVRQAKSRVLRRLREQLGDV